MKVTADFIKDMIQERSVDVSGIINDIEHQMLNAVNNYTSAQLVPLWGNGEHIWHFNYPLSNCYSVKVVNKLIDEFEDRGFIVGTHKDWFHEDLTVLTISVDVTMKKNVNI